MQNRKIKIYSDKKYLTQENHEVILFPFWGKNKIELENEIGGQFDDFITNGHKYFELTPVEDCDFVVLPENYNHERLPEYHSIISLAKNFNKPILIFYCNDSDAKIRIDNAIIFRTSLYKNNREKNEFPLPAWSEDFLQKYNNGNLNIKHKKLIPTISYCGYTKTLKDYIKDLLQIDYGCWRPLRHEAIKTLKNDKNIYKKFIIRNDFFGGAYKNNFSDKEKIKIVRKEYAENLITGEYALATRGRGNFSYRFYEIFNSGKIPVFINTDCVLPYEKFIAYKNYVVWLEDSEVKNINHLLLDFHNKIGQEDFINLQKEIREIWEEWFSPDGFFKHFYLHFNL
ncbi:MAG: Exostosin family protein [Parcubacteria group bacterium GW2011_GWE2_38_18]|nr:MAG: Exostosin family protein [Parcubacteria group bacterium GW2011_GWE2_38_18]